MNKDNKLSKDELLSKENNKNSELIDKLYSNKQKSEKEVLKNKSNEVTKLENNEESEKYTKEMHELADKNEFKNNVVVLGLGLVVVSVIIFSILMNTSFMNPKKAVVVSKPVTKTTPKNEPAKTKVVQTIVTSTKIFKYLDVEANRTTLLKKAVELNGGSQTGLTVHLLSEILRTNDIAIATNTTTVEKLMNSLTSMNWKKNTDATKLQKGDICFTTDMPGKTGVPSHAYVFMGWVKEGKTDYAYIVDGQVEEFNNILHKRNLTITTTTKDKFSFFLKN
ncbi:MAG: hypothetical protein ACREVX_16920 [Clostridium sp.]|uniref:hypothetical protein n=1 Tax=Clostridium sp. TaxID=1506 RepID=UPI003D6D5543